MKKSILLALIMVMLVSSVVLAATYEFVFPTNVNDDSGSTRNNLGVMLGYSGDTLVASGKIAASGLDTNMQANSSSVPYTIAEGEVTAVAPLLPANGKSEISLYTGYDPAQTSLDIVPGDNGFATIIDNVALELSNNFEVSLDDLVINTDEDKLILRKGNDFFIRTHKDGTINADIGSTTATQAASAATIAMYGASVTRVAQKYTAFTGIIVSAEIYGQKVLNPTGYMYCRIRNADDDSIIGTLGLIDITDTAGLGYYAFEDGLVFVDNEDIYLSFEYSGGDAANYFNAYYNGADVVAGEYAQYNAGWTDFGARDLRFKYTYIDGALQVTDTLASGTYDIDVYADAVNFKLDVDGSNEDSQALGGSSVTNNAYDYLLSPIATSNFQITVAGTLQIEYEPATIVAGDYYAGTADAGGDVEDIVDAELTQANDYWNGARVTITSTTDSLAPLGEVSVVIDFDGATDTLIIWPPLTTVPDAGDTYRVSYGTLEDLEHAFDAVLTWGYNSDITISYGEMSGSGSSEASVAETGGFDVPTAGLPDTWFAAGESVADLPFYDSFLSVSTSTGQPIQTIYFIAIIGFAIGAYMLLAIFTRSALLGVLGFNIVLFVGSSMTIIPMWIPFVCLIVQFGMMYLYKQVAY